MMPARDLFNIVSGVPAADITDANGTRSWEDTTLAEFLRKHHYFDGMFCTSSRYKSEISGADGILCTSMESQYQGVDKASVMLTPEEAFRFYAQTLLPEEYKILRERHPQMRELSDALYHQGTGVALKPKIDFITEM